MGKKSLQLIFLITVLLSWQCRPSNRKSPYILMIDDPSVFFNTSGKGDTVAEFAIDIKLYNKSNDTLIIPSQWARESEFYCTDNENLVIIDSKFSEKYSSRLDTIAPNDFRNSLVYFHFKKVPDTTFTLKIGMHMLKWRDSYRNSKPDKKAIEQANILWSDLDVVRTNKKHDVVYYNAPEEYKKQYEKVIDTLTDKDRQNYVLKIDERRIKIIKDTTTRYFDSVAYGNNMGAYYKKNNFGFVSIPIEFQNKSNSVLRYVNFSCSYSYMYKTDNKNVMILEDGLCLGNSPMTEDIDAHKSDNFTLDLLIDKKTQKYPCKVKIGLTLLKTRFPSDLGFIQTLPIFKEDPKYILWSKEFEINKH